MRMACLDLEGVLIPEVWIAVAEATGIEDLRRTTRDEPDYDALMRYRLDLLERHGLGLREIQRVIGTLDPSHLRENVGVEEGVMGERGSIR